MSESPSNISDNIPPAGGAEVSSVPLREDQIQNAVSFLTHPKVLSSPIATKRSFLERKGLTAAEIDEAFKRAPSSTVTSEPIRSNPVPSQQGQDLITYVPQQQTHPQLTTATGQPGQTLQQQHQIQASQIPQVMTNQPAPVEPLRWTQVLLGLGVVTVSVYALHTLLTPYVMALYNKVTSAMSARQEELDRRQKEATEAAEALHKVQQQLVSASESMAVAAESLKKQTASAADMRLELRELSEAVKSLHMTDIVKSFGGGLDRGFGKSLADVHGMGYDYEMKPPGGWLGSRDNDRGSVSPSSKAASGWMPGPGNDSIGNLTDDGGFAAYADYAKSQVDVGRNSHDNGRQQHSPVKTDITAPQTTSTHSTVVPSRPLESSDKSEEPSYPKSFQEVMEMVSKGITPPNVRTDIDDKPPDPTRPLSAPKAQPRPKPWERSTGSSSMDSGSPAPDTHHVTQVGAHAYGEEIPSWAPLAHDSSSPLSGNTSSLGISPEQPTLSVLEPLVATSGSWKPPALPESTIGSLARSSDSRILAGRFVDGQKNKAAVNGHKTDGQKNKGAAKRNGVETFVPEKEDGAA